MKEIVNGFERRLDIRPAWDKRDANQSKDYGVHGVDMAFYLIGPKGAVNFVLFTNWHLPHVTRDFDRKTNPRFPHLFCHPQPADLGHHSPTPQYEDQPSSDCGFLPGGKCFYGGSGLRAFDVYKRLLEQGEAGVWEALESEYRCVFDNGEHRRECLCASDDAYMQMRDLH